MLNIIRAYTHFQEIVSITYRCSICVLIGVVIICKNFTEKQQCYKDFAKRQKFPKRRRKCWM